MGGVALLTLLLADPSLDSLLLGIAVLLGGLSLRSWAFLYLGSSGRTRDPARPKERVVGGPYRWLAHPVYVSNMVIALALVVASAPGLLAAVGLLGSVALLYLVLSVRESRQLQSVQQLSDGRLLSARELARSERSTWLQLGSFVIALALMI